MAERLRQAAADRCMGVQLPPPAPVVNPRSAGGIFDVLWDCRKMGYSESSLYCWGKRLRHLARHCDLDVPESVKAYIAGKRCSVAYKEQLVNAYEHYVRFHGLIWIRPLYKRRSRLPNIPTTEQVNNLIAFCGKKYQAILTLAKYGLRPVEIENLRVKDFDFNRATVNVATAKGGKARTIQLTMKDMMRIEIFLEPYRNDLDKKPFPKARQITDCFCKIKRRYTKETGDNSYLKIRLYDFRHYYATMLYHKTKDILYVKEQLGHRRLENTLVYTHLVDFHDDEWVSAVARTVEKARELVEAGFEYVCDVDGAKLFRKRK